MPFQNPLNLLSPVQIARFDIGMLETIRQSVIPPPAFQAKSDLNDPIATFPEVAQNEIEIYPNPASDQLHVTLPEREKETTLFIQNQFGRTVWTEKFESQRRTATINLDGQNFQSGIYYLTLLSNDGVQARRLVIEKQ